MSGVAVSFKKRSAQRIPHAPLALQIMNQGVDTRRLKRVTADQQGMKRQDLTQALVLNVARDEPIDRAIAPQAQQVRNDLDHVPDTQKGDGRQLGEALGEDALTAADKF